MYSIQQIGAIGPTGDPNVLRQFIGNADLGWKVAYSDRMVSMYIGCRWRWLAARTSLSDIQSGAALGFGLRDSNAWLAWPWADAAFNEVREQLDEKFQRRYTRSG